MHCLAFTLAFSILLYRSEAFVVPARKAVIGNHLSLISATSFDEKTISQLKAKKSSEQRYDASPSDTPIQQQVEAALAPAANFLDDVSGGWALTYADLTPHSEKTLLGQGFLATNIAYTVVGLFLSIQGEVLLGIFTEICSVASFIYHYVQLQQPYGRTQDSTVRLALLVDYILASTSILIGLVYLVFDQALPPPEGIVTAVLGIVCLLSCWIWEQGLPYIILHGLWHLFSAASAYYIGTAHAMS